MKISFECLKCFLRFCLKCLFSCFSWFCHFDDDQYVNVAALEEKLAQYDSREDWYLGKPSIERPLEIMDRDSPELKVRKIHTNSSLEIKRQ